MKIYVLPLSIMLAIILGAFVSMLSLADRLDHANARIAELTEQNAIARQKLADMRGASDIELFISIVECESSGRHDAVGDGGASYGIAQFQLNTFKELARESGMQRLDYRNPVHQLRLMHWGLKNGYGDRWTCFRKLRLD